MSTEISIHGVSLGQGNIIPRVVDFSLGMGFSGLTSALEYVAGSYPDLLVEHETEAPGFRQFHVVRLESFLDHIEQHPYIWDSVGYGFEAGIKLMREKPELTWWFHVCF